MSNAEVVTFGNGKKSVRGAAPAAAATPAARISARSKAVADDVPGTAAHDNMISQLREIINGPQVRLNEARYGEFLDILSEQKAETETRLRSLEHAIAEANGEAGLSKAQLRGLDSRIDTVHTHFEVQMQELRQAQNEALEKLRSEQALGLQSLAEAFKARIKELEAGLRNNLSELSSTLVAHAAEDDKARERERDHLISVFEQRLSQARAEIQDDHRRDVTQVSSSIMDVGRKLMELRQG